MKQSNNNHQPISGEASLTSKIYTTLLTILIFLFVFVGYFHRITAFTQDLGRHILIGNIITSTHSIPRTNLLSYTYPDFPFLNHHWLSEVVLSVLFAKIGLLGLLLLATILALLSFGLVFFYAVKKTGFSACIAALLLLPVLFERTDIRPELFSFFLFSLFLVILFKNRKQSTKLVYLLPPTILLWVNLHIYFFTGIILIGLFLVDGLISKRRNMFCNYNRSLLTLLLFSTIATFFNPHGLQGALYPLSAFKNYGYTIEENQTIFFLESLGFHKQSIDFFKLSSILLFLSLIFNFKKTKPIDWLLSITFAAAGILAVRNLPLFALAVLIPFSTNLSRLIHRFWSLFKESSSQRRLIIKHTVFVGLTCIAFWQIITTAQKNEFGYKEDPGAAKAVNFLLKNNLHGPIFNNFDIGSYLSYRLYPEERVFIDGRPEAYPKDFFQNVYIPMQQDENIFANMEKHYGFNTIFFSHTDQTPWGEKFLQSILKNPSWRPVFLDQTVIVFAKNAPKNTKLIKRFDMNPSRLNAIYNPNDKQSLLQLASFFSKIGDTESLFPLLQQLLIIDPKNCQALYNRARIALSRQDSLSTMYTTSYKDICGTQLLQ